MAATAVLLEAISSPRRREILRLVWSRERTAGEIREAMPDVTFGAVSQQLRVLADAGLVAVRTESRSRIYKANQEAFGVLGPMLERMWEDKLWELKLAAELEQTRRGPRPASTKKKGKE